jgi:hypothetical protein
MIGGINGCLYGNGIGDGPVLRLVSVSKFLTVDDLIGCSDDFPLLMLKAESSQAGKEQFWFTHL